MAQRTAREIFTALIRAGFDRASAIIMTAIGLSESGGNDTDQGDLSLQDWKWGPSYGVFQVRTLKAQTGSGADRDIMHLMSGGLQEQANAAYAISGGGKDYTPWTVFNTGKFRDNLTRAQQAAADTGTVQPLGVIDPFLPWLVPKAVEGADAAERAAGNAIGNAMNALVKPFRGIAIEAAFGGLGLALVVLGVVKFAQPALERGVDKAAGVAKTAAAAAV